MLRRREGPIRSLRAKPSALSGTSAFCMPRSSNTPRPATRRPTSLFLRLYNRELSATTNWMIGRKRGPIETLLRIELARGPSSLTVITFNHDLLVENAVTNLPPRRFGTRWCLDHGYGFSPADVDRVKVAGATDVWPGCAGHDQLQIPILKLHGSLNWVFATRDPNPSLNLATQKKPIYVLDACRPRAGLLIRLGRARRRFHTWPVVVPPLFEKLTFIQHHLTQVWALAEQALLTADRIVFFGYSFPAADHHSRFFFERLATQNEALRWPTIINPDFDVVRFSSDILASNGVRAYRSFDDFAGFETPVPNP
jgi:hypothetical protein